MTKIINLWGGPGTGKSTTAAGLFCLMKNAGESVELAHEFAKEVVYKGDHETLLDQWYVTGHQENRLRRLVGKVDYVINDSPLPLGMVFAKPPFDDLWFQQAVWSLFNTFDNMNVGLVRVKPYQQVGRLETEVEADRLHKDIIRLLPKGSISVVADAAAPQTIYQVIQERYGKHRPRNLP